MKQNLALFDFDGTITTQDTLIQFIIFTKGKKALILGLILLSPWLIAYKIKFIPNWLAKQKVLTYFFKDTPLPVFEEWGVKFCNEILPHLLKCEALKKIEQHIREDDQVYIISASAEIWVLPWAVSMDIPVIATRLEVKDNKITGRIVGKNCYGKEKVVRLLEHENITQYNNVYVYGDSNGDKNLLDIATRPYYRCFN